MNYATFVRGLEGYAPEKAQLYCLHPPYVGCEYVVIVQKEEVTTGFSSDEDGLILHDCPVFWIHNLSPEAALKSVGYAL